MLFLGTVMSGLKLTNYISTGNHRLLSRDCNRDMCHISTSTGYSGKINIDGRQTVMSLYEIFVAEILMNFDNFRSKFQFRVHQSGYCDCLLTRNSLHLVK